MIRRGNSSTSTVSSLMGLPVGLLFFLIGLAVIFVGWKWVGARTLELRHWKPVPCEVTEWKVGVAPDGADVYKPTLSLAYRYRVNDRELTGTVLNAAWDQLPGLNELEELGAAARAGGQVCYVDPADPARSSLRQGSWLWPAAIMGFGLLFAGVGGVVMLGAAGTLLRRLAGGGAPPPGVPGRKGCLARIMTPVFFLVFAGTGFGVWKVAIREAPDWSAIAPLMRQAPAEILASGVDRHSGSGRNSSTTYSAEVAFAYEFEGRRWHSGWLDFDRSSSSGSNRGAAEAAVARHPAGRKTVCWVNPAAPWQAVLEKERGSRVWLWLFPVIFGGIGVIGLIRWLIKGLRGSGPSA